MELAQLNDKQKIAFKEFSEAIGDCKLVDSSDGYLLKWLAARNFDVAQAETMLRQSLEWRRLNQIDGMLDNWKPPEAMVKFYPVGFCGQDRHGCPVWIHAFGRVDFRGLLASVGRKDFLRYVTYHNEVGLVELNRLRAVTGKVLTQHTLIMDMEQLSMRTLTYRPGMEVQVEATKTVESYYPDNYRRVFIINAPKIFTLFFPMIKPFISQQTIRNFRIFGTDRAQWTAALLDEIDPSQLPVHYGGTLADPDGNPMYLSKICMGGEVPRSYYLTKKPQPSDNMQTIVVSRGSKKKLEFNIQENNSVLKWEFFSEDGDIGFHIYYVDGDEKVDVIPWSRVDCHVVQEEGRVSCSRLTTYVIEFDNSFSYLRSKKIWYAIDVELPAT